MNKEYIEERNGGLYVASTRVSLDSVIFHFRQGETPETILQKFPALQNLENVYGAITTYLASQAAFDEYLVREGQRWEEVRTICDPLPPGFLKRIESVREQRLQSAK